MKKSISRRQAEQHPQKKELELQKAVAQAWLNRGQCLTTSNSEFDTRKRNFHGISPSRFKVEAIRRKMGEEAGAVVCFDRSDDYYCNGGWDFNQSLWDSYEIVAVSKRLEEGLMLGGNRFTVADMMDEDWKKFGVRRRESKNSLRNLMRSMVHSKRY